MTISVTLCRRNCHVYPYMIGPCFRTFPKFKLIMPFTFSNTNWSRIMTGHCQNSSIKATVGAKLNLGVSCALYMPCALGQQHTVIITVKNPSQDRA